MPEDIRPNGLVIDGMNCYLEGLAHAMILLGVIAMLKRMQDGA